MEVWRLTGLDAVFDGISAALQDLRLRLSSVSQLKVQQLLQLLGGTPLTDLVSMDKHLTVKVSCSSNSPNDPLKPKGVLVL